MDAYGQFCPVSLAAEIFARRWTPVIVRELLAGSSRFNDLRRGMPNITASVLSRRLDELEIAGIVERLKDENGGLPSRLRLACMLRTFDKRCLTVAACSTAASIAHDDRSHRAPPSACSATYRPRPPRRLRMAHQSLVVGGRFFARGHRLPPLVLRPNVPADASSWLEPDRSPSHVVGKLFGR